MTDYLALLGDASDNVPGVKGIGEKGAVELLQQFGDLETILANAANVTKKRSREALLEQAEQARLSKRLVTIKTDVPVELDLDALVVHAPDKAALMRFCQELEFASLVPRLGNLGTEPGPGAFPGRHRPDHPLTRAAGVASTEAPSAPPIDRPPRPDLNLTIVTDAAELPALVAQWRAAPMIAFDTETSSLEPHDAELIGLSIAIIATDVWYMPFGHRSPASDLFSGTSTDAGATPPRDDAPKNLPADHQSPACAPLAELLRDPSVHEGRAQPQVRRAGDATRRDRGGRPRLRLDAGVVRRRPVAPIARHRCAGARGVRHPDDAVHRPDGEGEAADPLRRGIGGGRGLVLRRRQRDGAGAARLVRARPSIRRRCARCSRPSRCR